MKKTSILINAARGGVVNESHLIRSLQDNKIAVAGVDVFENEPLDQSSPLLTLKNVVLTPHLGASTAEAQIRVALWRHPS